MTRNYTVTIKNAKNKKKSSKKKLFIFIGIIIILVVGFGYGYTKLKKYAQSCQGDECNPLLRPLVNTIDPKLDKNEDGTTNILLIGVDTRENNKGLMNTDTMIILTIDHNNKTSMMTSIPRDLWVKYTLPNVNSTSSKVNSVYAFAEAQQQGKGIDTLKEVVFKITGFEINYYVKVTLKGFVEAIDTIEGIDIYLENTYKDIYPKDELPDDFQQNCILKYNDGAFCMYTYPAGDNHLTGQYALIYARMRMWTSDFDRARRQQEVINATKKKILSTETLLDPTKLWDMYNIVKEYVETSPFSINDIRAAINLKDSIDTENTASVVLDPNFGNYAGEFIIRGTNPNLGYYIEAKDLSYESIKNYLAEIRKNPKTYNERPVVSIYNATGNTELEEDYKQKLIDDNSFITVVEANKIIPNDLEIHTGIKIYKLTGEEMPASSYYLKEFFDIDEILTEVPEDIKALKKEQFIIVIGK